MKVLLINGSPHEKGCTYTALNVIAEQLKAEGVDSQIVWIGTKAVRSCIGCGGCRKNNDTCVFADDVLNSVATLAKEADGYIFGAPVHYSSPNGAMISVMDRLFMSAGKYMQFKPAASIVSARRAGTTASYDVLNKYIGINNMLQVPSCYWNMVHGSCAEDVLKDEEGVAIMRTIACNMAWMLKILKSVEGSPLQTPTKIEKVRTNFIR